jgi:transketolase
MTRSTADKNDSETHIHGGRPFLESEHRNGSSSAEKLDSEELERVAAKAKAKESRSHWRESEQRKYVNYLVENRKHFQLSVREKKARGVHTKMSQLLKSRTASQCRSHHQKMLHKFGSIENVIEGLRDLVARKNLEKVAAQPQSAEKSAGELEAGSLELESLGEPEMVAFDKRERTPPLLFLDELNHPSFDSILLFEAL